MRTLFITHHYLTSNGGGSFASRAYINAFAELSDEMTLLYPVAKGEDVFDGINPNIELVPVSYSIASWKKAANLLSGKVHRYYESAPEYICSGNFDTVVFDTSVVSFRLIHLAKQHDLRTIVIHHNYQYEYFKDNTSGLLKPLTLFWCRKYEGEAVHEADLNLTLTMDDAASLTKYYDAADAEFRVLGTFEYNPRPLRSLPDEKAGVSRFVLTGNLGSMQTELSVIPWLKNYYPVFKEMMPDASLVVAGHRPSPAIVNLCRQFGIELVPSPESLDPILESADAYLCPTCLGSGLKLRVMDGFRWGLPVLSHIVSARGYEEFQSKGFLYSYSDLPSFRTALKSLAASRFSKQEINAAFNSVFSFRAGVERLRIILSK